MEILRRDWMKYIENLSKADDKAAELITDYLSEHSILSDEGFQKFVDYYYAVVTKYAEGASEMAAQAYEILAEVQGATIKSAEPAETPTYGECMKTIRGTMLDSDQAKSLAQSAGRLVRRTGVDTTINNALRDGAEWAWVPNGDTCAFCMMLASNGWQRASKKAIKNGHASHVHANCDCTYAIRFDGKSTVEGYDPDYYKALYDNAEGTRWQDKLNSMRRAKYAANPEKYRLQKRMAYRRAGALLGAYNDENDPYFTKREKIGNDLYAEIKNRKRDFEIKAVSSNTSFTEKEIDTIFAHIFENEHLFEDGTVRQFDPDYYMAHSWLRLREGKNIQTHDIIMLHHELEEAKLMNKSLDYYYEKAHNIVEKKWNYKKALLEYLKEHEA